MKKHTTQWNDTASIPELKKTRTCLNAIHFIAQYGRKNKNICIYKTWRFFFPPNSTKNTWMSCDHLSCNIKLFSPPCSCLPAGDPAGHRPDVPRARPLQAEGRARPGVALQRDEGLQRPRQRGTGELENLTDDGAFQTPRACARMQTELGTK